MSTKQAQPIAWHNIRALAFDIYGTLIDCGSSEFETFTSSPMSPFLPSDLDAVLSPYKSIEDNIQEQHPGMKQYDILVESVRRYAKQLDLVPGKLSHDQVEDTDRAVASSMGAWRAFPDTIDAMQRLGRHFKLIALSNTDREIFDELSSGPLRGMNWDASYVAEEIGSSKPDLNNVRYLFKHCEQDFGIGMEQMVQVANSLSADHDPAKKLGYTSVWIKTSEKDADEHQKQFDYQLRFGTLGELADVVDAALEKS